MDRQQKKQSVADIKENLNKSKAVLVTHYHGLTVSDVNELRSNIRNAGAQYKVVKNSLAKLALEGTSYGDLNGLLSGPTAIIFSDDPVSAAKTLVKFAKGKESLKILGGVVENQYIDSIGVDNLSKMLSLDELRAKIIGLINAPARNIVGVLQAPAGQVARVIGAFAAKNK